MKNQICGPMDRLELFPWKLDDENTLPLAIVDKIHPKKKDSNPEVSDVPDPYGHPRSVWWCCRYLFVLCSPFVFVLDSLPIHEEEQKWLTKYPEEEYDSNQGEGFDVEFAARRELKVHGMGEDVLQVTK